MTEEQMKQENESMKTALVNEVMLRQQIGAQLATMSSNAQSMQLRFGEELQAIRGMAKAKDFDAILKKVNSLIGGDANEVAQPQLEHAITANESDAAKTGNRGAGEVPEASGDSASNS